MKKRLLFTAYSLDIGGMETALVNLLNNIDYDKYEVVLVLEKKEGIFLNEINKNVIVKEVKVSNCKISILRKIINFIRKFKFKRHNKNKFDFSCCYATYSYSANKLALIGSENSMIYVHNNYKDLYQNDEKKIREFFDTRSIDKYKYIVFVSNESKKDFEEFYPSLASKTLVFNNFINIPKIVELSKEKIDEKKPLGKLFVYVGRLDEKHKRITRAIELISKLDKASLWIVGDGPDREEYESIVLEKHLEDKIKFLGKRKNPYPYILISDYIILTSDYEGFPVTYLEALALNKAIITTVAVSDEKIDMRDYAYIVSKDTDKMIKEVKKIESNNKKFDKVDIDSIQKERIFELEKCFNSDINYLNDK